MQAELSRCLELLRELAILRALSLLFLLVPVLRGLFALLAQRGPSRLLVLHLTLQTPLLLDEVLLLRWSTGPTSQRPHLVVTHQLHVLVTWGRPLLTARLLPPVNR